MHAARTLSADMNFSRVSGLKKNPKLQILTNAAMPQNRIIRRSSSSDLSEEYSFGSGSSLDSLASDSSNSFSITNPPPTPRSSDESPKFSQSEEKPGILSLLAKDEAKPSENKNIVLSYQLKADAKPLGGSSSSTTKIIREEKADVIPNAPIQLDEKPLDKSSSTKTSSTPNLIEFCSREITNKCGGNMRFFFDPPCVFSQLRYTPVHALSFNDLTMKPEYLIIHLRRRANIDAERNNPFPRPLTLCTVHKCAGFLRLEDIQDSESYTRVDVNFPRVKVTHRFNDCILLFPPINNQLIRFRGQIRGWPMDFEYSQSPPTLYLSPGVEIPSDPSSSNPPPILKHCMECYRPLDKKDAYLYRFISNIYIYILE